MAGMTTSNSTLLTRQEIWSRQLKDVLLDDLFGMRWVDILTEFPDGDLFTIPSIGEAETQSITEDQAIRYDALDTGEWQFQITEYEGSAHYITRKAMQDTFYADQLLAQFVPKERRALMERIETDILKAPGPNATQSGTAQTVSDANAINSFDHRYVATGSGDTMTPEDFAYAKLALKKANVPLTNLVAIVDPPVAYTLETATNIVNVSNNPQWEGIITSGLTTGMRFVRNIYGFDVYESNYLDSVGSETVSNSNHHTDNTTVANGVQNILFSADSSVLPIKFAMRQEPIVDAEFNKDYQREEYVTTARWGVKLYRQENMICILTDGTAL